MDLDLSVVGVDEVVRELRAAERDVAIGGVIGLTRLASRGRQEVIGVMRRRFDRPTPWTMKAISMQKASLAQPWSVVELQDETLGKGGYFRDVLRHQFVGGLRNLKRSERNMQRRGSLPQSFTAAPSKRWRTDPYGNMPPMRYVELLSYLDQFDKAGFTANMGAAGRARYQRRNALRYFVASRTRAKTRHLAEGVWAAGVDGNDDGSIYPVLMFGRPARYRRRIDLPGTVIAMANKDGAAIMAQALKERLERYR